MKKQFYVPGTLLLFVIIILAGCTKPRTIPLPDNLILSNKPLPEVQAILLGKWQLHYMRGGFCGVCEYQRENEFFTFGPNDQIRWTIDKTILADTILTWFQQEWLNKKINVMEWYATDGNMHLLSPDLIEKDTLQMFEPGSDGMRYYFTKVK